jgi:hypothetical protein
VSGGAAAAAAPADIDAKFRYNQDCSSIYARMPSPIALRAHSCEPDRDRRWARERTRVDHSPLRDARARLETDVAVAMVHFVMLLLLMALSYSRSGSRVTSSTQIAARFGTALLTVLRATL